MRLFYANNMEVIGMLLADFVIGDPQRFHPVCFIGKLIEVLEGILRALIRLGVNLGISKELVERICGIILTTLTCFITFGLSIIFVICLLRCKGDFLSLFSELIFIIIGGVFIALKGLIKAEKEVESLLIKGNLELARKKLKALVGRDTEKLGEKEIRIAIIESLAENLNDGVIAPIFYLLIGGLPLLVLYKTINTLDSMVGYKSEKYLHFGWFSARMDDLFNFIPARLAGLCIVIGSVFLLGFEPGKRAFKIMLRDGRKHTSPNSGIPEAAMAGALGLRLGGPNYYSGILIEKPYIGDEISAPDSLKVKLAEKLVLLSTGFFFLGGVLIRMVIFSWR